MVMLPQTVDAHPITPDSNWLPEPVLVLPSVWNGEMFVPSVAVLKKRKDSKSIVHLV
jgi:hypothetical protein